FPVCDPRTGEEICQVEESTKADVDKAVKAARNAFRNDSEWRKMEAVVRLWQVSNMSVLRGVHDFLELLGNTIILKPAEETPLMALYCASLLDEVGRRVQELAIKSNFKRLSLELFEKCPLIICEDADLDSAVALTYRAIFADSAQSCFAGSRIFVHEKIYDRFVIKCVELVTQCVVGDPFDPETAQGPQINDEKLKKIIQFIESGKKQGAKLECGGERFGTNGFFVQPTIFSNVTDDMDIASDEMIGPIMSVLKYHDYDEVITRANNTKWGLAAGMITKEKTQANYLVSSLQARTVWINEYDAAINLLPFGRYSHAGGKKDFGGYDFNEYYELKRVATNLS
ncbi:unnamed protein product, partial [Didymodactylos carnosus]